MADLIFPAVWQALDGNANPLAGGKAYFYDTGTTTPRTVYSDVAGTVPHPSPLVADSSGVFPEVFAVGGTAVKVVVQTAAGATIYTQDPVTRTVTSSSAASVSFTPTTAIPSATVQAAIERVQQNLDAYNTAGAVQADIINGDFSLWQRGVSFSAAGYTADRWRLDYTGGTATLSRQAVPMGDMFGPNSPVYHARLDVAGQAAAGDYGLMCQRIEGVRTQNGQTVTVMGYVRRTSGAGNLAIDMSQNFGTGGSPSAQVNVTPVTVALSPSWAPFAASFTLPSVAGKTLGTNGDGYLQVAFWASAGSTWNARTGSLGIQTLAVDFWGINIRRGTRPASDAALYLPPSATGNQMACERFFQKSYNPGTAPGTAATGADMIETSPDAVNLFANFGSVRFRVPMRAIPTLTPYNPETGSTTNPVRNFTASTNHPLMTASVGVNGFYAYVNNSSIPSGNVVGFHYTAEAEL